jgi:hypothetical protein
MLLIESIQVHEVECFVISLCYEKLRLMNLRYTSRSPMPSNSPMYLTKSKDDCYWLEGYRWRYK